MNLHWIVNIHNGKGLNEHGMYLSNEPVSKLEVPWRQGSELFFLLKLCVMYTYVLYKWGQQHMI